MSCGQIVDLAPDGADLVALTAVQTQTLVEDHITHSLLLNVVVEVALDQRQLLLQLLLGVTSCKLSLDSLECLSALVLSCAAGCNCVCLVVGLGDDLLTQLLVVHLVAVGTLNVLTQLLAQLDLNCAVLFDLLVSELDCVEHNLLRNLLHLTLDHQNIVDRTADHNIQIDILHLREGGVDDELAIDASYANLRNGAAKRNIRNCQCSRCCQTCQRVSLNILIGRDQIDRNIYLSVEIRGEKGAQSAVDQTSNEDLVVAGASLTFEEAAGESSARCVFLFVIYL